MSKQVSIEDAFPVYRQRVSELVDEVLLLRTQVAVLERENAALKEENTQPPLDAVAQSSTTPVQEAPTAEPSRPGRGRQPADA